MKILIIDDNEAKRDRVKKVLADEFGRKVPRVAEAIDYDSAMRELSSSHFDLVILDLMLPGPGNEGSPAIARAIINNLLKGTAEFPPSYIIGLTAYEEAAAEEQLFYGENLLSLEIFSETDDTWANKLVSKIRYLEKSKAAAVNFQANSFDIDVVVLVARYEREYVPIVKNLLNDVEENTYPLWPGRASFGTIVLPGMRALRAVVCCIGEMGLAPASAVTSQAIALFRPRLVSMLGMCCGFNVQACSSPRRMLDAIVVREVSCWEEGRIQDEERNHPEFKSRAKVRLASEVIRQKIEDTVEAAVDTLRPSLEALAERKDFAEVRSKLSEYERRDVPDVQFAAMVSGSSVVADSNMITEVLTRHPTALGLDMEMFAVYAAVERSIGRKPAVLGIKGVADFGGKEKHKLSQVSASIVSAVVLKHLLPHMNIW